MKSPLAPMNFLFILVNGLVFVLRSRLTPYGWDADVVLAGNILLFALSRLGYSLHLRGMRSKGGASFLGTVYGAFLLRLVVSAAAVFTYAGWKRSDISWPAVFTCMFLYLVYTFLETRAFLRSHGGGHAKD